MTVTVPRRFRFAPILTATVLTVLLLYLFGKTANIFLLLFVAVLISLYLGAVAEVFQQRLRLPPRVALGAAIALTLAAIITLFSAARAAGRRADAAARAGASAVRRGVGDGDRSLRRPVPGHERHVAAGRAQAHERDLRGRDGPVRRSRAEGRRDRPRRHQRVLRRRHGASTSRLYPGLYREWVIALFPPIHRDLVRDVLADLRTTLRAWIVGQLLAMVVLAVLTAFGLYLLDVPYCLTFGVFTGAVAIVPFFGTLVSTTIPALFVLGGDGFAGFGGVGHAVLVILLGTVIHLIESNLVIPLITAKKVELPPVLTIMSVLVVGSLLGPVGLLVAVPTLAVVMVVLRRILINRIYEGHGFRRASRDRALVLRVPAPEGGVLVTDAPDLDIIAEPARAA